MNKTEFLKMALEKLTAASNYIDTLGGVSKDYRIDIERLKAALANEALERKAENARELGLDYEPLEAKDEKANDELRRLHDLLGKANALARIRANKIDELEQRLTKTEAQLGEAVWNYGELKREQLANQQKTSGSPINTSTALEAKDEPYALEASMFSNDRVKVDPVTGNVSIGTPQRTWVGLTDKDLKLLSAEWRIVYGAWMDDFAKDIEAKLKEKNHASP